MDGIKLTKAECQSVYNVIGMLSGGNPENVFAWNGEDSISDAEVSAFAKIFHAIGERVPDNLLPLLVDQEQSVVQPLKPTKHVEDKPHPTPLVTWFRALNNYRNISRIGSCEINRRPVIFYVFAERGSLNFVPIKVELSLEEKNMRLAGIDRCQSWLDSFAKPPY